MSAALVEKALLFAGSNPYNRIEISEMRMNVGELGLELRLYLGSPTFSMRKFEVFPSFVQYPRCTSGASSPSYKTSANIEG